MCAYNAMNNSFSKTCLRHVNGGSDGSCESSVIYSGWTRGLRMFCRDNILSAFRCFDFGIWSSWNLSWACEAKNKQVSISSLCSGSHEFNPRSVSFLTIFSVHVFTRTNCPCSYLITSITTVSSSSSVSDSSTKPDFRCPFKHYG